MTDRIEKAKENFLNGMNCSQSVIAPYAELFGLDETMAKIISEPFGGGMGRMRLTCGAVSGMFMLVGLAYSKGTNDMELRKKIYAKVQELASEFEKINGSIICGDLLGVNKPKDNGATPTKRTDDFYKKRPCVKCVEDCAQLFEKYVLSEIDINK